MYNVGLNDLAVLVSPLYLENTGRVCKVVAVELDDVENGRFWRCTFTTPIKTMVGMRMYAILSDEQLRRLTGNTSDKFAEERKEMFEKA